MSGYIYRMKRVGTGALKHPFPNLWYKGALEKLLLGEVDGQPNTPDGHLLPWPQTSALHLALSLSWPHFWSQAEDQLGVIQIMQIINCGSRSCVF